MQTTGTAGSNISNSLVWATPGTASFNKSNSLGWASSNTLIL